MQRQLAEELDGFAHDLHAYVCAPDTDGVHANGARLGASPSSTRADEALRGAR
jgi:biopolymer transport protein ExbB